MVIYEGNHYLIDFTFPDTKFDENAKYWIEDNSEIAKFIMNAGGHFKITDSDSTGKILAVEEYYPIEELKESKKQEINNACSSLIYSGYDYNGEHYDLADEDQINMMAWSALAQQGKSVPYHSSGNPCRVYSSEEFLGLVDAVTAFKTYNLTYCNLLKLQVEEMENAEEIKNVVYGVTQLNEKYGAVMNGVLGANTAVDSEESSQ